MIEKITIYDERTEVEFKSGLEIKVDALPSNNYLWQSGIIYISLGYLLVINVVTLIVFAIDKIAAIEHRSRIRIVTLLALCFIGGSIGGLLAMYVFRHKTRQDYFSVGVPLIMIMQVVVIFYIMNGKV